MSCKAPWRERDCFPSIGAEDGTKTKAYDGTGRSDKISSMCGHESHCDSKIEAARRRKVGVDCYFMPSVSIAAWGAESCLVDKGSGGAHAKARCSGVVVFLRRPRRLA